MITKLNSSDKPSLLELSVFSGQLDHRSNAAINYPFLFAALSSWMTEVGTDFAKIVSDIKLGPILGDGFVEFGTIEKTRYPTDLTGKPWQKNLVSKDNTQKRAFAESGIGLVIGMLMLFIIKTVGIRAILAPVGAVHRSVNNAAFKHRMYSELDELAEMKRPPSDADLTAIQMGLADLLQGMSQDERSLLARGHQRLVP